MRWHSSLSTILILAILGGGAFAAWKKWIVDDRPERVQHLKSTLIAQSFDGGVSDWKRARTTESLMREVDQLTEEQRKAVWEDIKVEYRDWQLDAARTWSELPEAEQTAFLDEQLDKGRKWQKVFFAMRTEVPHVPKRFRRSYVESEEGKQQASEDVSNGNEQEKTNRRAGDRGRSRGDNSARDGRRDQTADSRRQRWRGRGGGMRSRENEVDQNDPDAVLISQYRRAMMNHMRAKWDEQRDQSERGPGRGRNGPWNRDESRTRGGQKA